MATHALHLPRYPTTHHAIERFVQRVRPDLDYRSPEGLIAAELALWQFMEESTLKTGWPSWDRCGGRVDSQYLANGDVAVMLGNPVDGRRYAQTVLVRPDEHGRVAT